jgi:hypothetical protein
LNRGTSITAPAGYADGVGLENRYYLSAEYDSFGGPEFDVARAPFLGLGYYPTRELVDTRGRPFEPRPFARAYLTADLVAGRAYLFGDATLTGTRTATPKLLEVDVGAAARPLPGGRFGPGSGAITTCTAGTLSVRCTFPSVTASDQVGVGPRTDRGRVHLIRSGVRPDE